MTDDLREALTKAIDRADPPGGMRAGTPSISVAVLRTLLAAHPTPETEDVVCICNPAHRDNDTICQWRPAPVSDTRREDVARVQREAGIAITEADEWLNGHRVSESWRVINRLRDTLMRTTDVLAALPAPPVVDEIMADVNERAEHATFEGGDFPVYSLPVYEVEEILAARLRGATRG